MKLENVCRLSFITYTSMRKFIAVRVSDGEDDPVDIPEEVRVAVVDHQFLDRPQRYWERDPFPTMQQALDHDYWLASGLKNEENFELFVYGMVY